MNVHPIGNLAALPDKPRYNIKAVSQQTGVNVSTLRAWEARYGFPEPDRSEKGHRRYSERDVALVQWLRERTEEGIAISQAVELLQQYLAQRAEAQPGDVEVAMSVAPAAATPTRVETAQAVTELLDALEDVNFQQAQQLFDEVCRTFPLEVALLQVFRPLMIEVGERWLSGELHVTGEQLGTTLLRQWLLTRLQSQRVSSQPVRIICGCVPGEQHDMGILMFALLMQQRGHEVLFLGANMSMSGLDDLLKRLAPAVLCISASLIEHVPDLLRISRIVEELTEAEHDLALVFGGRVFEQHPALLPQMPGFYLGNDIITAVERVSMLAADVEQGRVGARSLTGWLAERGTGIADQLEFMKEPICNTVSLRLSKEFPELGRLPGRPDGAPWREQVYNETPRRFHRMLQVVLRCQALDVIEQEYRWAWLLLPRFGIQQEHLLSQVGWYFDAVEEIVGVEPEDRGYVSSFREAIVERVARSTATPALPSEQAA